MSIGNSSLRRSPWKSQPSKGTIFIFVIAAISFLFELIFGQILHLDVGTKLTYITISFVPYFSSLLVYMMV